MLIHLYAEALLANPELADQVWELWSGRAITDALAALAWCMLARIYPNRDEVGFASQLVLRGTPIPVASNPISGTDITINITGIYVSIRVGERFKAVELL